MFFLFLMVLSLIFTMDPSRHQRRIFHTFSQGTSNFSTSSFQHATTNTPSTSSIPNNIQNNQQRNSNTTKKKCYRKATPESGFHSTLFAIPNKTGDLRPVLNLRPLDQYIPKGPFKIETMQHMYRMIQPRDWLTSIDMQDAFLHILVHKRSRHYLRFSWNSQVYQFHTLCFGMSLSPMVITKILRPVLRWARSQGIWISGYLGDLILAAKSKEQAHLHTQMVLSKLYSLCFWVKES